MKHETWSCNLCGEKSQPELLFAFGCFRTSTYKLLPDTDGAWRDCSTHICKRCCKAIHDAMNGFEEKKKSPA